MAKILPDRFAELFFSAAAGSKAAAAELAERCARELESEVRAIVLYGSLARGAFTEGSDLDALLITGTEDAPPGLYATTAGIDLDLHVLSAAAARSADPAAWIHLAPGRPLHDPAGAGAELLARVRARAQEPPPERSPAETERAERWCHRMLQRIEQNLDRDPVLATLQAGWLRTELYEEWFKRRRQWTRSARDALAHWRADQPGFAALLEQEAQAAGARERLELLRRITGEVLGPLRPGPTSPTPRS